MWKKLQTMAHMHHTQRARLARGFSLIELMISITIGLVVVIAAMSAYLGSSEASKVTEAQSRMNEDAQAALNLLTEQIRLAGANPVQANRADAFRHNPVFDPTYVGGTSTAYGTTSYTVSPATATVAGFSIRGCDGTFTGITSTANITGLSCGGGTTTLPDSIAVSYEADPYNTSKSSTGAATDCVGSALPTVTGTFTSGTSTTGSWSVADNRFYVASSSSGIPSLYCKGSANTVPQPIVENVENIQFKYGVVSTANTSNTATIAGYLTADQVVTESTMAALANDFDRWGRVLTVRVCVVVRSEAPVVASTATPAVSTAAASYVDCDGGVNSANTDRRLRRAYTSTVVLRNRRN
jgi:type IV pilus assembly protein PilW